MGAYLIMLRIKICHLNGEEEQHVFNGDVSFVIGRTNTRVIEFSINDEKETELNYEDGANVVVANWGKGL